MNDCRPYKRDDGADNDPGKPSTDHLREYEDDVDGGSARRRPSASGGASCETLTADYGEFGWAYWSSALLPYSYAR